MKPLLIFDYDGVLHDTLALYEAGMNAGYNYLLQRGLTEPMPPEARSKELFASFLGLNPWQAWKNFMPELSDEHIEEVSQVVAGDMATVTYNGGARWYEGAAETLDKLKNAGYKMVVLSNCTTSYADSHWEVFAMDRWFEKFYDAESYGLLPKSEIAKTIVEEYPAPSYMVIGDRLGEWQCAQSMGCPFIACDYGFDYEGEIAGAEHHAKCVTDLFDIVQKICEKK